MLIAIMTIFFLGGGSSGLLDYLADAKDSIEQTIPKGEEQKTALATIKAMKKTTKARSKFGGKTTKTLGKLLSNHETTNDEIDAVWEKHFAEMDRYNQEMLDLRFELKTQISRKDWETIFSEE